MQLSGCQGVFSARPDPGRPLYQYQRDQRTRVPEDRCGCFKRQPARLEEESDTKCRNQRVP